MRWVRIIESPQKPDAEILVPASKSISNRVLIIRALSGVDFPIYNLSTADDTILLRQILAESENELYINTENAGTVMRFLTAYFACSPGKDAVLTGDERMQHRPVAPLVDALNSIGAEIAYRERPGYPPLHIEGRRLKGGHIVLNASESSQFATALLLIAPMLENGLTFELAGEIASESYLRMTLRILSEFGIQFEHKNNTITVPRQPYLPKEYFIESDWSSAGYWYGFASLFSGSRFYLPYLNEKSLQGDSIIAALAGEYFGTVTSYDQKGISISADSPSTGKALNASMLSHPDLIPTIITLCCLHKIPFRIEGISTLRHKESDRGSALKTELAKLGFELMVEENTISCEDFVEIPETLVQMKTYNDHRLAMCWAMIGAKHPHIQIENPDCVSKSYPHFWEDLEKAGFKLAFENRD